jgi:hypothetical protein
MELKKLPKKNKIIKIYCTLSNGNDLRVSVLTDKSIEEIKEMISKNLPDGITLKHVNESTVCEGAQ